MQHVAYPTSGIASAYEQAKEQAARQPHVVAAQVRLETITNTLLGQFDELTKRLAPVSRIGPITGEANCPSDPSTGCALADFLNDKAEMLERLSSCVQQQFAVLEI